MKLNEYEQKIKIAKILNLDIKFSMKLLYQWVKTDTISFKEFEELFAVLAEHIEKMKKSEQYFNKNLENLPESDLLVIDSEGCYTKKEK